MKFVPGQVVNLKSGGQPLTVVAVDEDSVECIWLGEEGDLFRESIPTVALELAFGDESADLDSAEAREFANAQAVANDDDDDEDEEEDDEDDEEDQEERRYRAREGALGGREELEVAEEPRLQEEVPEPLPPVLVVPRAAERDDDEGARVEPEVVRDAIADAQRGRNELDVAHEQTLALAGEEIAKGCPEGEERRDDGRGHDGRRPARIVRKSVLLLDVPSPRDLERPEDDEEEQGVRLRHDPEARARVAALADRYA